MVREKPRGVCLGTRRGQKAQQVFMDADCSLGHENTLRYRYKCTAVSATQRLRIRDEYLFASSNTLTVLPPIFAQEDHIRPTYL